MILFKDQKVAFLFPPKTGSTTALEYLLHCKDAVSIGHKHTAVKQALRTEPNLRDYTVYAFLRNPAEWLISGLLMFREHYYINNFVKALERDDVFDSKDFAEVYYIRHKNLHPLNTLAPQIKYFNGDLNVIALDFDNYESELRRATQGLGLDDVAIGWENKGVHDSKKAMAKKVISLVKSEFADDCALWQERFGKVLC